MLDRRAPQSFTRSEWATKLGAAAVLGSLVGLSLASCSLISGVDEYKFGTSSGVGAAAATGSSTGAGQPTSTGSACGVGNKSCDNQCVSTADPQTGCDSTSCTACTAGASCCPSCADMANDPRHCGNCNKECAGSEWCSGSACTCRPGLTSIQGSCVDTTSDPNHCGGVACGGATENCQNSVCGPSCSSPNTECNGACVDTKKDPQHCGDCTTVCATNEVCVTGKCFAYEPATGCSSCPCTTCANDFDRCCPFPKTSAVVCVTHSALACP